MIIQSPNTTKMASTASVQSWLGQKLETLGVDAVVYTRYILSIFQQDSFDLEQDPDLMAAHSSIPSTHPHHKGGVGGSGGGNNSGYHHHQASSSSKREKGRGRGKPKTYFRWQSPEDLKKDAVVKCLQSVTEKDCGIEGLVEELCLKLKKVQEEREEVTTPSQSPDASRALRSHDTANETERYYEAFPSLSDKTELAAADIKPKGAWRAKPKRNNSTGSLSSPPGERELESLPKKSVSASVSRNSSSPVGFQGRQYQRAQSLPNSLSRNRNRSPSFVVPKYQGRKGHRSYTQGHERGSKRHNRDRDWNTRGGDGKYGRKKGDVFPEWYKESGEGQADMSSWDGRNAGLNGDPTHEVLKKEDLGSEYIAVKEEEKLEEAVNTMAETLCRSIMEECDDDQLYIKDSVTSHELLGDDREMYMFGSGDSLKEWYAGSTRVADFEYDASMAPITVEGQVNPSSSIWEKNLVPGSPLSNGHQEPWGENARSCLPTTTPNTGTTSSSAVAVYQTLSGPTSPQSLLEDSAAEEASETTSLAEELRVDINHHHLDSTPISPRNAPIGTGRNSDTLLRICDHTHAHSHPHSTHGASTQAGATWGNPSDSSQGVPHAAPAMSCQPSDQSLSADEDSLVQGICSSQKDSSFLNISGEAHSLDMNNALWATYETKQPQVHPPKIVTWDESIFSGFQPLAKASAFIEGGVYGSPYSSHNNSQFNSCSTSPCNDSSIRELWEGSHSREASSVCSLEYLLSPQPCAACSVQDEQSIIEDSLVDSPKYLCSRSSSRFDFARSISDAENSNNSSPRGTETDEMISEDEWVEEAPRDAHEAIQSDTKDKTRDQSDSDRTPQDKSSAGNYGGSANSQQGSEGSLVGSGKGTIVSQHLLSADWKKHDSFNTIPEPMCALPTQRRANILPALSSDPSFMSSKSHFKPIQQAPNTNGAAGRSATEIQPCLSSECVQFTGNNFHRNPGSNAGPLCRAVDGSDSWKPNQASVGLRSSMTYQSESLIKQGDKLTVPTEFLCQSGCDVGPSVARNCSYQNISQDAGALLCLGYSGGAGPGAGIGDPGGGRMGSGYYGDTWSYCDVSSGTHLDRDPSLFADEDDVFLHEGLLVDQPVELHSRRQQGRHGRKGQTNSVCKEFLEGRCTNSMCGFSHDPGHMTCGQWLEGRCQRGSFCQFMHGYTSDMSSQSSSRAESRTGSVTPDESEDIPWEHQRSPYVSVPNLMRLPGYQGLDDAGMAPPSPREGTGGVEHMRSQPIKISSKTR